MPGMKPNLLDVVNERVLVCDGAMGTQLFEAGLTPGACGELWNIDQPTVIQAVHQRYRDAGCDLITTNTFGGMRSQLERHGLAERVTEINKAAAEVARNVVGDDGWALGDIGPFGDFLEPIGEVSHAQLTEIFTAQARALHSGGVDAFIVETMSDVNEMAVAIKACKHVDASMPVLATYAFESRGSDDLRTMMGVTVEQAVTEATAAGADVVGANCGTSLGLDDYRALAAALVKFAGSTPVSLQPNAGSPRNVDESLVYDATPEDMAALANDLVAAGVRGVGGCCGTTPTILQAMAAAIKN